VGSSGQGTSAGEAGLAERLARLEARLVALEGATADFRRRHLLAELRSDPSRLLAGVAETQHIVRENLDELAEVLARWEAPLSPAERIRLRRAGFVGQAVAGAHKAKLHLVVDVVERVEPEHLEGVSETAKILADRARRAIPVLVCLESPPLEIARRAEDLGVELVVDP